MGPKYRAQSTSSETGAYPEPQETVSLVVRLGDIAARCSSHEQRVCSVPGELEGERERSSKDNSCRPNTETVYAQISSSRLVQRTTKQTVRASFTHETVPPFISTLITRVVDGMAILQPPTIEGQERGTCLSRFGTVTRPMTNNAVASIPSSSEASTAHAQRTDIVGENRGVFSPHCSDH